MEKRYSRVISNQVRFGYGYDVIDGKLTYYAWHGYPNRNDDYITYSKITKKEFDQIEKEYPEEIIANSDQGNLFRDKYVDHHKVLIEGWNASIINVKRKEN